MLLCYVLLHINKTTSSGIAPVTVESVIILSVQRLIQSFLGHYTVRSGAKQEEKRIVPSSGIKKNAAGQQTTASQFEQTKKQCPSETRVLFAAATKVVKKKRKNNMIPRARANPTKWWIREEEKNNNTNNGQRRNDFAKSAQRIFASYHSSPGWQHRAPANQVRLSTLQEP